MVKEQNIALNPAKISGICGRLMCCMSFEHRVYKDLWAGLPGPGSKIKTPLGNYIVVSMDISKEAVRCHKPGGGDIIVPIGMFTEFKESVMSGKEWETPEPEPSADVCQGKKTSCAGCKGGLFDRLAGGTAEASGGQIEGPRSAKDRSEREARQAASFANAAEAGGNRSRRRKGRRGPRKQQEDAIPSLARGQQDLRVVRLSAQLKRSSAKRSQIKGSFAAAKAETALNHGETERIKRPRRRRRSPKGPGDEVAAT